MKIFKTRLFDKWASNEEINDETLEITIKEMERGLIDASLGSFLYKKRIATKGKGKRGAVRVLLAYKTKDKAFFLYGFSKKEKANITRKEEKALKALAIELMNYNLQFLHEIIKTGELAEIINHEETNT